MLAFKAYRLLSSDPTYTTPLATAGEESTVAPRRVLPQECSRAGVQGVHVTVIGPDVHHAVGHRRRRIDTSPPSCTSTGVLPCWRSRRTRYSHRTRRTPRRWPPPAKNRRTLPVVYFHRSAPVLAFKAYTLWSSDPTYTTPLATAGEEKTDPPSCTSTGVLPCWRSRRTRSCHRIRRTPRRWPPPAKNRHCSPSCTSTGVLRAGVQGVHVTVIGPDVHHAVGHRRRRIDMSPVVYFHRSAPVLAFKAYTLPSSDPTYTTPLATAGEEST